MNPSTPFLKPKPATSERRRIIRSVEESAAHREDGGGYRPPLPPFSGEWPSPLCALHGTGGADRTLSEESLGGPWTRTQTRHGTPGEGLLLGLLLLEASAPRNRWLHRRKYCPKAQGDRLKVLWRGPILTFLGEWVGWAGGCGGHRWQLRFQGQVVRGRGIQCREHPLVTQFIKEFVVDVTEHWTLTQL